MLNIVFDNQIARMLKMAFIKYNIVEDVIPLTLELSMGPIDSLDLQSEPSLLLRKNFLHSSMCGDDPLMSEIEFDELWTSIVTSIHAINSYPETSPICLWWRDLPRDLCGLYFLLYSLRSCKRQIYGIPIPRYHTLENQVIDNVIINVPSVDMFQQFWGQRSQLSNQFISMVQKKWISLCEQDSPMRIVLNSELLGVDVNFYDQFLLNELSLRSQSVGQIVSSTLCKLHDVSDCFLYQRILALANLGYIQFLHEKANPYNSLVVRRKNPPIF